MKIKVLTIATKPLEGLALLQKSLNKFKIEFTVIGMGEDWKGFGTKTILLKNYIKSSDLSHFILVDAYDILFINGMRHILEVYKKNWNDNVVFSAEKNCWPDYKLSDVYPKCRTPWRYLNAGSYVAPVNKFLEMIEPFPIDPMENDQAYFTRIFLNTNKIKLDTECRLFQSLFYECKNDFTYGKKLTNNYTGSKPCIIHGNGNSPMSKIHRILNFQS